MNFSENETEFWLAYDRCRAKDYMENDRKVGIGSATDDPNDTSGRTPFSAKFRPIEFPYLNHWQVEWVV